jgi:hypothetical protein
MVPMLAEKLLDKGFAMVHQVPGNRSDRFHAYDRP